MYLWRFWPAEWFNAMMSWKPGVHKLHGVTLPRNVEYSLSTNLKYLFPVQYSEKVAIDWFEELCRKVRIQTYFWLQGKDMEPLSASWQETIPYSSTGWDTDITTDWFAEGIQDGRKALSRALSAGHPIPRPDPRSDVLFEIMLPPHQLREWLREARLLSLITDKNLGIVVVTRNWYEQQIQSFLDLPIFSTIAEGEHGFDDLFERTCEDLEKLRRDENGLILPFLSGRRIERYWNQCHLNKDLPIFHGIPKIHKNPWKIRPIVPMHSYVTGPLARILHGMLLPVQRSFYWICESSRNLCAEVASFNRSNQTSVSLHTGDVTAMYTNIKWRDFRFALGMLLIDGQWYDSATRTFILNAAELLWTRTMFQLSNRVVRQEDGVPMGLHCAPVFANLFMAYHEATFIATHRPALYRRYIDDIFALDPTSESLTQLTVPGLEIQWHHSDHEIPFLDVLFHMHPGRSEVCFSPYTKALNHNQYIPWASSHPLSVKKGMVKGELTRIRAICYKEIYFLTWKASFVTRLLARGWPKPALHSWGRQVQWRPYFRGSGPKPKKQDSIIAVSEYNPVWEQVSSPAIWKAMRKGWLRRGPPNQPYPPHCLVARKRTRSMWDLVRAVNRNLLKKEIEEIDIEDLSISMDTLDTGMPYSPLRIQQALQLQQPAL